MKRVLVVDDQIDIQEILADYLRNRGYETEAAANGLQALEFLGKKSYDLIMTDLMMPTGNGFDFIDTLKTEADSTPVIIMTGGAAFQQFNDKMTTLKDENYIILKKPFSKDTLKAAIMSVFKNN